MISLQDCIITKNNNGSISYNRYVHPSMLSLIEEFKNLYSNYPVIYPSGVCAIDSSIQCLMIENEWKPVYLIYGSELYCDSPRAFKYLEKMFPLLVKLHKVDITDEEQIKNLVKAGCKFIQVDEPLFARKPKEAIEYGIKNLEKCFEDISNPDVEKITHICCGYPDKLDAINYPKAPLDSYHQIAELLDNSIIAVQGPLSASISSTNLPFLGSNGSNLSGSIFLFIGKFFNFRNGIFIIVHHRKFYIINKLSFPIHSNLNI